MKLTESELPIVDMKRCYLELFLVLSFIMVTNSVNGATINRDHDSSLQKSEGYMMDLIRTIIPAVQNSAYPGTDRFVNGVNEAQKSHEDTSVSDTNELDLLDSLLKVVNNFRRMYNTTKTTAVVPQERSWWPLAASTSQQMADNPIKALTCYGLTITNLSRLATDTVVQMVNCVLSPLTNALSGAEDLVAPMKEIVAIGVSCFSSSGMLKCMIGKVNSDNLCSIIILPKKLYDIVSSNLQDSSGLMKTVSNCVASTITSAMARSQRHSYKSCMTN